MKKLIATALVTGMAFAAPLAQAEGVHLVKGSKSYQQIDRTADARQDADPAKDKSLSSIEPASGDEQKDKPVIPGLSTEPAREPLHEQMRLPRKGF